MSNLPILINSFPFRTKVDPRLEKMKNYDGGPIRLFPDYYPAHGGSVGTPVQRRRTATARLSEAYIGSDPSRRGSLPWDPAGQREASGSSLKKGPC